MNKLFNTNKKKKGKLISDYGNLNIVISVQDLLAKLENYHKYDIISLLGLFLTLSLNLYFCDFKDKFGISKENIKIVYIFITIFVFGLFISTVIKAIKSKKIPDICDEMVRESFEAIEHTAVFIIKQLEDNNNKILVQNGKWSCYFLPYTMYDKNSAIEEQKQSLTKNLAEQIGIDVSSVNIKYLEDMDTKRIKRYKPANEERLFEYKFFSVEINPVTYHKLVTSNNNNCSWKTLKELLDDGATMAYNNDIVNYLKESNCLEKLETSCRKDLLLDKPLKIIWNITNKCPYNCNICCTDSNSETRELSYEEKIRGLVSISTLKDYIKEIDFAGGDPLANKNDKEIIKYANCIFNMNVISVSTTGKSLKKIANENLEKLFGSCDLTYDYPLEDEKHDKRESDYNFQNFEQAKRLKNIGMKVNIQIPILPSNLNEKIISKLVKDIKEISPDSITLLRYMPVGKKSIENYPSLQEYDPNKFITIFNNQMKEQKVDVQVKLQCALRVKYSKCKADNYCNMYTEKIGIDHLGNVYFCAWGGNIKSEDNNFYIGNIIEKDLKDILIESKKIKSLKHKLNEKRNACSVFSYLNSENRTEDDLFSLKDPII